MSSSATPARHPGRNSSSFVISALVRHSLPIICAELARLPFTVDVATYLDAFLARLAHAGRLTPYQQAQLFTGGLPEHIRIDVELHDPQDLQRAMRLARAYERRNSTP
jgi:hypothetical protein